MHFGWEVLGKFKWHFSCFIFSCASWTMWGLFVYPSFYFSPPSFETGSCYLDQVRLRLGSSCLQLQKCRHASPFLALEQVLFSHWPACPSASKLFLGPWNNRLDTKGHSAQAKWLLFDEWDIRGNRNNFFWAKFSQKKKTKVLWESGRRKSSLWLRKSKRLTEEWCLKDDFTKQEENWRAFWA